MGLRKYTTVLKVSFQQDLEYKFNFLTSLIFSFIPFFTNLLLWFVISRDETGKFGYSLAEFISYYFIVFIVDNLISNRASIDISNDVRTGDINKLLIKPVNFMLYHFILTLPRRLTFIILGSLPIAVIGIILRSYLTLAITPQNLIIFILALLMGYIINFLMNFLLSLLSFFLSEVGSLFIAIDILKSAVSGKLFPLSIVPKNMYNFLMILPFQFAGYFPAVILLNNISGEEVLHNFYVGIIWMIILYVLCVVLYKKGLNRYSAYGG